ncbi:hypothetical protein [Rhodobacter sp. TJ_12]|uniref:hypothetical protein n=1 Tax=Rhodobacter sp. TJ_12 TaxID=2029399 RepID=UPI001CBE3D16|nr:hypothetical protein [Rhodobacter sp. TJ_12]
MNRTMAVLVCLITSTPAAAEVCDKVRPAWTPQDGPVGQLDDLALFLFEPIGLIAIGLTVGALLLRSAWFSTVAIVILMLMLALNVSTWREADGVTRFAISEGCMVAPYLTTIVMIAMAASIVTLTWIKPLDRSKSP